MSHYYRDEIVAQAKALTLVGYSGVRIAKELPAMFPSEKTPAERTIHEWAKELRESAIEEMRDDEVRIARRMDTIVHDYLDQIENRDISPGFSQVMLGWGLAHSKVKETEEVKRKVDPSGKTVGPIVIILNSERPEIIEGEVREVE